MSRSPTRGIIPRNAEERATRSDDLRPYHVLWTNPEFQRIWVGEIVGKDMAALKQISYRLDNESLSPIQAKVVESMGLANPKSQEEQLRTFLAVRAVANYFERKLVELAHASELFEKMRKEQENA